MFVDSTPCKSIPETVVFAYRALLPIHRSVSRASSPVAFRFSSLAGGTQSVLIRLITKETSVATRAVFFRPTLVLSHERETLQRHIARGVYSTLVFVSPLAAHDITHIPRRTPTATVMVDV